MESVGEAEFVSMVDLFPMIMRMANIPLTDFYQYIIELHDQFPIRTGSGIYMDKDGVYGVYSEDNSDCEALSQYYYFEYNSFQSTGDYKSELFE